METKALDPVRRAKLATPSKPLILVVDDEAVVRSLLGRYLPSLGFEVLTAESGLKALEYVRMAQPDLVLLDITMPGQSGLTTLRELRKIDPKVLVIMLTAIEDPQIANIAIQHGAKDYLTKPVELHTIEKVIRTHLALAI